MPLPSPGIEDRDLLEHFLDVQRAALAMSLDGLREEEARSRLVPSLTTALGLVKHAAVVERVWFHSRVGGIPRAQLGLPDDLDASFLVGPADTIDGVRNDFLAACAHSRHVSAAHSLEASFPWRGAPVSLRFIYLHMTAELARHAGHADILVEQLTSRRRAP